MCRYLVTILCRHLVSILSVLQECVGISGKENCYSHRYLHIPTIPTNTAEILTTYLRHSDKIPAHTSTKFKVHPQILGICHVDVLQVWCRYHGVGMCMYVHVSVGICLYLFVCSIFLLCFQSHCGTCMHVQVCVCM